jgi:outer membrane translocation and assembly module TamA
MNTDSLQKYEHGDIYVIDPQNKFKPKIFDRALYFKKGDLYNRTNHNLTLNRLISLGVFKFVKNEFIVSDSLQHKFDTYYLLTPRELQSLRLEALGRTNSANYAGSEVNLNWTHRNFFRGAEQFKASVYGAFDFQIGGPENAKIFSEREPMRNFRFRGLLHLSDLILQAHLFREPIFRLAMNSRTEQNIIPSILLRIFRVQLERKRTKRT